MTTGPDWREVAKEFRTKEDGIPEILAMPSIQLMAEEIARLRKELDFAKFLAALEVGRVYQSIEDWRAYSEKLREALKKIDNMSDDNGAIQAVIYDALALKKPGEE